MNKINVVDEVQQNFLDSSLEVNMNRAFPDVRDGLKPGQRACLWEMYLKKYTSKKPHVKSAKVSGGVISDLWPHGDTAIYETFARMSQQFINNCPEVDWHGANGNVILGGDALAHQRYTECRLAPIVEEGMLKNIDKQCVDMIPNFSEDMEWPKVFPAIFPRLLVNGSQGIGVSLSQVWLPHGLSETIALITKYLQTNELDADTYYPDFPTGATIVNQQDLAAINKTGKGKAIVEAKYEIAGNAINFYEFPYQVYIEPLIEEIKKAIDEGKINGIKDLSNRSDKKKLSLVVECDGEPETVVQYLFAETSLRKQYNANQNGIVSKTPILLNLQQYIDIYVEHNLNCIQREFTYEYDKATARIHILEGLIWAVDHIDEVIDWIREGLDLCNLTDYIDEVQKKAILDMRLARLSKLEEEKLIQEKKEKEEYAEYCNLIIQSQSRQKEILVDRLRDLDAKFGDQRRTNVISKEIIKATKSNGQRKVIVPEDVFVSITTTGYLKAVPVKTYKQSAADKTVFKCQTDDMILLFSSLGKVYRLKVNEIKQCASKDKGTAIGSILNLESNESILNVFPMNTDARRPYIIGFTKQGMVKKSEKSIYVGTTQNKNGMKAAGLNDGDIFVSWYESNGDYAVMLTNDDYLIKFDTSLINACGKTAKGVRGIKLNEGAEVTNAGIISPQLAKFKIKEYNLINNDIPLQKRSGKGKCLVGK